MRLGVDYKIRNAREADLEEITAVEAACFPESEAADQTAFAQRLRTFPESFFVAWETRSGRVIGFINGCVTDRAAICDEMFHDAGYHKADGRYQSVFGLAVLPDYQRNGVASAMMEQLIADASAKGRKGLILTCKDVKIRYYERFGYANQGVSESVHGGSVWYDMLLTLDGHGGTGTV